LARGGDRRASATSTSGRACYQGYRHKYAMGRVR